MSETKQTMVVTIEGRFVVLTINQGEREVVALEVDPENAERLVTQLWSAVQNLRTAKVGK